MLRKNVFVGRAPQAQGIAPVLEIECIPKLVIIVSDCIPGFRSVCPMCIPTFKCVSIQKLSGHPSTSHASS